MIDNPLLSVIVPVYNVEPYLRQCIDSVIKSSYKNLEIILVDDGSTDNCGRICDEYALADNRIQVIHKKNGGLSSARNAGLDGCRGDLVTFIDSDDYIDSDTYLLNIPLFDKKEIDIVYFPFIRFYEDGRVRKDMEVEEGRVLSSPQEKYRMSFLENKLKVNAWNKIYRRSVFDNLRFPEGLIFEDRYIMADIFMLQSGILMSDKGMYYYRQHLKQTFRRFDRTANECRMLADLHIIEHLRQMPECHDIWVLRYYFCKYDYLPELKQTPPVRQDLLDRLRENAPSFRIMNGLVFLKFIAWRHFKRRIRKCLTAVHGPQKLK